MNYALVKNRVDRKYFRKWSSHIRAEIRVLQLPALALWLYHLQTSRGTQMHKSSTNATYFQETCPARNKEAFTIKHIRINHINMLRIHHLLCPQKINHILGSCVSKNKILFQLPKISKPKFPNKFVDFSSKLIVK